MWAEMSGLSRELPLASYRVSALGHKRTSALHKVMSALPPTADICGALADVR